MILGALSSLGFSFPQKFLLLKYQYPIPFPSSLPFGVIVAPLNVVRVLNINIH